MIKTTLTHYKIFFNNLAICQHEFYFLRWVFHPRTTLQAVIIPGRILTVMKISLHFSHVSSFANCFKTSVIISYVHVPLFSCFEFSIHKYRCQLHKFKKMDCFQVQVCFSVINVQLIKLTYFNIAYC